jgi:hypothetical protein
MVIDEEEKLAIASNPTQPIDIILMMTTTVTKKIMLGG